MHAWSVDKIADFWLALSDFVAISYGQPCTAPAVIDEALPMDQIPAWMSGATLNFAENLLAFSDDQTAIIYTSMSPRPPHGAHGRAGGSPRDATNA